MRQTPDEHKDTQVIRVDPEFHKALKTSANLEGKTMREKSKELSQDLKQDVKELVDDIDVDDDNSGGGVNFL
jgi:tRNA A37 threonylcarbamoyladenosine synthetase subunit TsaC/SUA5/YrdC